MPPVGQGPFTLDRFGWLGGDIGAPYQAALNACVEQGFGCVDLPPGFLNCDRAIDWLPCSAGPAPNTTGITVRGCGSGATTVFHNQGSEGLRILGNASANGFYVVAPRVQGMSIRVTAGAQVGLLLYETLFGITDDVFVTGAADAAIRITDGGFPYGTMNFSAHNTVGAQSRIGWHIPKLLKGDLFGCASNQNAEKGWHIEQCNGLSVFGLHVQDNGIPIHIAPAGFNGIGISFYGKIYAECPTKNILRIDRCPLGPGYVGNINVLGGMTVQGGHDDSGEVILANDCALTVSGGRIEAQGWTKHIRARTMESLTLSHLAANPALYDIDADSRDRTSALWQGEAVIGGVRMRSRGGRLQVSADDLTWRQLVTAGIDP